VRIAATIVAVAMSALASCYRAGPRADDQDAGPDLGQAIEIDCMVDRIETFWGAAPDEQIRLQIFDALWTGLAHYYAAFETTSLDWDLVREVYRPRIAEAESQGRFHAVLSGIFFALRDGHTVVTSEELYGTLPDPYWPADLSLAERPPLFWIEDRIGAIGACVTPLDDGTLLVYRVDEDNPLDLAPGDVVIGYDGETWADLLTPILHCGFPLVGRPASTQEGWHRKLLGAAVNNPHLFDEIDVWRRATDTFESRPTETLLDFDSDLICNDQIPAPGVEPPCSSWSACYGDPALTPQVTWGLLPETNVGYVYIYSWQGNAGELFAQAVAELMDTDGLILDQRSGPGGGLDWDDGLALLFAEDVWPVISFMARDPDSTDYEALAPDPAIEPIGITADPLTEYDRPIAVLIGPHAGSAGDVFPYLMSLHPRARLFGRPTDGRFGIATHTIANSGDWFPEPDPYSGDLFASFTVAIMADGDGGHLQGLALQPAFDVWLDQEDVADGVDTVVRAALEWIAEQNGE
jgi:C-terminal processing protease CtpA/Prc